MHMGNAPSERGLSVKPTGGVLRMPQDKSDAVSVAATFGPLYVKRRESTRGSGRRESGIMEALEIIRREACSGLSASELAARFPDSRKNFERRFRKVAGHSILDEILHVRLERAKELLLGTDADLEEVSAACGFGTEQSLRVHFRLRFGASPRQWRREHLGAEG